MAHAERNIAAENAYAALWDAYQIAITPERRYELGKAMDALQPDIARGPDDPRWQNFIDTLPGYREFWASWHKKQLDRARGLF